MAENKGGLKAFLDRIYSNIGGKIKELARATFVIESGCLIVAAVILPFVAVEESGEISSFFAGLLLGVLGLLVGFPTLFVLSWPVYAAGELVEKVCAIAQSNDNTVKKKGPNANDVERQKTNRVNVVATKSSNMTEVKEKSGKFCPACGTEVMFEGTECAFCGARLDE